MSAIHQVETECVPALPDFFNEDTAKRIAIPKKQQQEEIAIAMSRGIQREQRVSVQAERSVWAVTPFLVWSVTAVIYAVSTWFVVSHANQILWFLLTGQKW